MGLVQSLRHGPALLPPPRRLAARSHHLFLGRCRGLEGQHRQLRQHGSEAIVDARLIIVWGGNPVVSNLHGWRYMQAKRRGARLV